MSLAGANEKLSLAKANEKLLLGGADEKLSLAGANQKLSPAGANQKWSLAGANQKLSLAGANQKLSLAGANQKLPAQVLNLFSNQYQWKNIDLMYQSTLHRLYRLMHTGECLPHLIIDPPLKLSLYTLTCLQLKFSSHGPCSTTAAVPKHTVLDFRVKTMCQLMAAVTMTK